MQSEKKMAMPAATTEFSLTDNQRRQWELLLQLYAASLLEITQRHPSMHKVIAEETAMAGAFREFAFQLHSKSKSLLIRGFRAFPNLAAKRSYLAKQRQSRAWMEDGFLFTAANALGIQSIVSLPNGRGKKLMPDYLPTKAEGNTGLKAKVYNHGAVSGGSHWSLEGRTNISGGDCGPATMAQAILRDRKHIERLTGAQFPTRAQVTAVMKEPPKPRPAPQPKPFIAARPTTKQIQTRVEAVFFAQSDRAAQTRRAQAQRFFRQFNTLELLLLARVAYRASNGDAYMTSKGQYLEEVLDTGVFNDPAVAEVLNEDLVETLAIEAGRSGESFRAILDYVQAQKQKADAKQGENAAPAFSTLSLMFSPVPRPAGHCVPRSKPIMGKGRASARA